jgi:maltose O-acetyltransferase
VIWRILSKLILRCRMLCWRVVYRDYRRRYSIAPSFRFNGAGITLYGDGLIELGEHSYIGEGSSIQSGAGLSVRVGHHCRISHNVRIYTATALADSDFIDGPVEESSGSVVIEDGVWIGTNVYIAQGVTVGANSVIGANAVVTRSVPAHEIWGGVPARLLRRKNVGIPSDSSRAAS